jgi:NAD(P)-dependent dehydrogenase (short-subunit alcohol dehydrogenase family)
VQVSEAVAVVTGGASGLGLATVHALLGRGAHVVLVDLGASFGADFAAELGERAHFAPADVTNTDALAVALDLAETLGPLRIVVNCAGTSGNMRVIGGDGPHCLAEFNRIIEVNLIGTFNVLRLAAERIAKAEPVGEERGVIINTASVAAFEGQIGQAAYSASKGGVVSMTLPIARDLSREFIRVVTIAPGLFNTPLMRLMPNQMRSTLSDQVPHPRRLGDPDEFAALAVHIVENPMLNGEVIRLDGAIRMAPQ